ncbi:GNAT family N-acetyltransferase [Rapidithrix thailandica]|uniref:GNAT family N-acetyltransferase n=1 Tax=Rapidithrix thailandica TaxID=413964 RepID=A0AAW9S5W8_9BACT
MSIRSATLKEAELLTQLASRSKAHWGYDDAFLQRCAPELQVKTAEIRLNQVFVIEHTLQIAGFYMFSPLSEQEVELTLFFIDPPFIGQGLGKRLFKHALQQTRQRGFTQMFIQSDPFALPFYQKMGALLHSEKVSESTGRSLPLLLVHLEKIQKNN